MKNPLVSIIIPVYNCEKQISRCLNSIIGQSYTNIEIIVINDGSTDNSEKHTQELASRNQNIIVSSQKNEGVSSARNCGVKRAKGKYITFIDGDDYIDSNYIKNFVQAAEETNAELCVCGYTKITEGGKELLRIIPSKYQKGINEEFPYRMLATWSRFYRMDFWRKNRMNFIGEKDVRGEDVPIALFSNVMAKNVQCVNQAGYFYVQHLTSARNTMRGLKSHKLPYEALEKCIQYVFEADDTNSKQFFELGVFRVFTTFLLDISRGAGREKVKELYAFEDRIIKKYFSEYIHNDKLKLFSKFDIPLQQKVAVKLFVVMYRMRVLYYVGVLLGKNNKDKVKRK